LRASGTFCCTAVLMSHRTPEHPVHLPARTRANPAFAAAHVRLGLWRRSAARGLVLRFARSMHCLAVILRAPYGTPECGTGLVYVSPGRVANSGVSLTACRPRGASAPRARVPVRTPKVPPRERACPPREGACPPREGARSPREGARFPREGARFPREGARFAREGARFPREGARFPREGARFPREGARFPREGARVSHARVPVSHATGRSPARGCPSPAITSGS
jgi:hypothetical protein